MAVNKVSKETKEVIRSNSVLALPDRPTEKGYTAQQLKEYFTNLVLGDSASSLTELDRVVDEINEIIGNIEDKSVQKYVVDTVIGKFTEQAPLISIRFEDNKLKYTKYGNESSEIDITPNNSVFFDNETLKSKNNASIYPKTTLDNIIGEIDDKSTREFLLDLKSKIVDLQTSHDTDIASIEKSLSEIIGGNAPDALNSIKELADALQNDPTLVNGILLDIVDLKNKKVDKLDGYGLSKNDYTNSDKAFLDRLRDEDVALKSDIKTHLNEMGQDSDYRTVTDDEKNTWNSKANAVHKHEISQVNGLQDALDGKSDTGHTHTLESLGAEASGTAEDLISSHNNSLFAHMRIQNSIDNLKKKVDGINNALSFETLSQLQDWLNGTYARPDGKKPSDLYVGQHLYIKDQDENDYWVSETPVTIDNLTVLVTDKIDLDEYTLKSDLKRVAFTGDYGDLSNRPTIPSTLDDIAETSTRKTITQDKLTQIDTNKSNIDKKLNKTFGSSEANKMVVTDNDGNIVTAEAGSMAFLVDNLESTSTTMAPTANQVRVLNNKKLDKQLGSNNAGKVLKVNSNGVVDCSDIQYSEIKNTPTDLATQIFVKEEIAKIPTPDVSGQIEEHNQNEEAHPYILGELNKKVSNSEFETTITGIESDLGEHDKQIANKANQSDLIALSNTVTSLGNTKEDKTNLKALAYKDSLSKVDVGLGNVTNTSDADKPVSTATQNALNLKANTADLGSLAYKDSLTASDVGALPSDTEIPSISGLASETYVNQKIADLVNGAPGTLDTLDELASALKDNANIVDTLNAAIENKADKTSLSNYATITNLNKKLDKTTYEYNKELAIGSTGKVLVGKFPMYDSNVTISVSSTTNTTFYGTLVIATQNINDTHGGNYVAKVYNDPTGTLSSAFVVKYPTNSRIFEVYCNFPSWSKNLIHIQAVALKAEPTNIVELITTDIPTESLVTVNNVIDSTLSSKYLSFDGGTLNYQGQIKAGTSLFKDLYVEAENLRVLNPKNEDTTPTKIATIDSTGYIKYRTPSEIKSAIGLGDVGAASRLGVDTTIGDSPTDTSVPTSQAVKEYIESKGLASETDLEATYMKKSNPN